MRCLIFGDLQISFKRPDYMRYLEGSLSFIRSLIRTQTPDLVVNLGDTLDTFGVVDVRDLVWSYEQMSQISQEAEDVGAEYWVLKGNHDCADKKGECTALDVFKDIDNMVYFPKSSNTDIKGVNVAVLPWTDDRKDIWTREVCETVLPHTEIVFGHIEWKGCRMTPTFVSTDGVDPDEFHRKFPKAVVFNGHYHQPARVGPVYLVGSPLNKDFNDVEAEEPRGALLYDTETKVAIRCGNDSSYKCLSLFLQDGNLQRIEEIPLKDRANLKLKVYVPRTKLQRASEIGEGFLWYACYPLDSDRVDVEKVAEVRVSSTPAEIVEKAVQASTADYNRDLLMKFGAEAFSPPVS